MNGTMTDWICFVVAFGVVAPWLLAGACLLAEWAYKAISHCWRMLADPLYREVEIRFRADLVEAGLDNRTIPIRPVLWWSCVVASACLLLSDLGWCLSTQWLWSMSGPLIALEIAAILVASVCLNLATISFVHGLRARRQPAAGLGTDDNGDWDDLLRAAETLSAQYDAIADGDRSRAAKEAHRMHYGFGDESRREKLRLVKHDRGEP